MICDDVWQGVNGNGWLVSISYVMELCNLRVADRV